MRHLVPRKLSQVRILLSAPKMISITKERYEELLQAEEDLQALEDAGVDNWEGYELAFS